MPAPRSRSRCLLGAFSLGGACLLAVPDLANAGGDGVLPAAPVRDTARVELGRRLFFDPAASRTGTRSCADCHDPAHGFSDPEPRSLDARKRTSRHSQTLIDGFENPSAHWDGAFRTVEDLVRGRLQTTLPDVPVAAYYGDPEDLEVGPLLRAVEGRFIPPTPRFVAPGVTDSSLPQAHIALGASRRYQEAFESAGLSGPTESAIVKAIAAFCHSIRSGMAPYDRYAAGDADALSPSAVRGLALFRGKGGCVACHTMEAPRARFTDYAFHDTGVEWLDSLARFARGSGPVSFSRPGTPPTPRREEPPVPPPPPTVPPPPPPAPPRTGPAARTAVRTGVRRAAFAFKTPTLRDVARRGPYLHDGSCADLAAVVRFYLSGRITAPTLDPKMPDYRASDAEVADLVAFLRALTSEEAPGTAPAAWNARAPATTLRFVDADEKPLAGWALEIEPAGAVLPGHPGRSLHLQTDAQGRTSYGPPATTHVRLLLPHGLQPEEGCWVPDTCREAEIVVPVRGRGRLEVVARAGLVLPEVVELEHPQARTWPDHRIPRTILRLEDVRGPPGSRIATYAGPIRTDVPIDSVLVAPAGLTPLSGYAAPHGRVTLRRP